MERTDPGKVNMWLNTLEKRTRTMKNAFGVCVVVALLCLTAVLAFATYEMKDVLIVILLLLTLVASVPVVEVATPKKNAIFSRKLTLNNWQQKIAAGNYDILSSNLHFMQPVFPILSVMSFLLFAASKFTTKVEHHTVLLILILQIPLNPMLGLNPLGMYLMRSAKSRFVAQSDLIEYQRSKAAVELNRASLAPLNRAPLNRAPPNRTPPNRAPPNRTPPNRTPPNRTPPNRTPSYRPPVAPPPTAPALATNRLVYGNLTLRPSKRR